MNAFENEDDRTLNEQEKKNRLKQYRFEEYTKEKISFLTLIERYGLSMKKCSCIDKKSESTTPNVRTDCPKCLGIGLQFFFNEGVYRENHLIKSEDPNNITINVHYSILLDIVVKAFDKLLFKKEHYEMLDR